MNGYIELNGLPTWVDDDEGSGDPVVLLHGAYGQNDPLLSIARGALDASRFRVIAFERRGHGRTADTDEPFHYETMADETIALLRTHVGGAAHVVGFSDGANTALLTALREPGLVKTMVLIGGNFDRDGVLADPTPFEPGTPGYEITKAGFGVVSPNGPEHFAAIVDKTERMIREEPTVPVEELRSVAVPTLVIVADDDVVSHGHTVALYENLPDARLAIVPGASHLVVLEKPAVVGALIADFLADPAVPQTIMPIRRASRGGGT